MSESIILVVVSGLLVIIGTLAGTVVNYCLQQRQRESDRRRDVRENELRIVSDGVDSVIATIDAITWGAHISPGTPADLGREPYLKLGQANVVALSLGNKELLEECGNLVGGLNRWGTLLNATGRPTEENKSEYEELGAEMRGMAATVRRRINEMREKG